jgi:sugar lactone lactonase YvrE
LSSPNIKVAEVGLHSTQNVPGNAETHLYVGAATVELAEPATVVPTFGATAAPAQWLNESKALVSFTAADTGLGVSSVTVSGESASPPSWKATQGCTGIPSNPCPYTWKNATYVEPGKLATGIDKLKLVAEDPLAHVSSPSTVEVAVDHTAPELTLAGSLNEQLKLGTTLPKYALTLSASDGEVGHPQSGVAKTTIKVDGKVVDEYSPGCSTENCQLAREWTLESSQFEPGAHTIEAIATDAVGNSRTKTLKFELHPTPPPALTLTGSLTEQATFGTERPRYSLTTSASASPQPESSGIYSPGVPMYLDSFGAAGTGNGQFTNPGGVAVDAQRDALVTDAGSGRIERFNAAGEYLSQIGSKGAGNGQLTEPAGIAVDAKGNIWVANAGNNRIEEYNGAGEYLARFGSKGTGNGQFEHPEGIAVDPKGNIWVADTRNGRLQEFNEKGEFIKVLGTKGTASGQLYEPAGLSIGANGNIWVADWHNNAVLEFNEAATFVRQFGTEGTGNAQFVHPGAVSVDNQGKVWVVDAGNSRVEVFNEKGVYLNQFGSKGTAKGQLSLTRPVGISTDRQGDVWVTDNANKRVEKWHTVGPNYVSTFGTKGSANGQLSNPAGIARDSTGNLWVVDSGNNRVEKFSEAGAFLTKFGFKGTGAEAFTEPTAIAIDPKGNLWIADSGNNRLEEFSSAGKYLKTLGSKGVGNGQFERPEGLAFDSNGNLWVSDTHGARLEEFNEAGSFLRTAGAKGTTGALGEPMGIAIDSKNNVWVADSSKNRIAKFNERGEYVSQIGTEGSGALQLLHPSDVYVDPAVDLEANVDIWVADSGNDRITKTALGILPLGQFGAEGSAPGEFSMSHAAALTVGPGGNLWVTDAGNNRVERLHETTTGSTVATEVTVDGTRVDSGQVGCANESCSVNHEWTLESSAYAVGKHTVVVSSTDGVGRTTTKTLTIEVQRDETKPTLEASGSLFEAPMGWVEQQNYSVTGKAADAGAGVTQLKLMIDGKQAGIATQTCANGGCALTNTFTIDTGEYPGGAHEAELIATDGAGNSTTKKWTINVDPGGKISVLEAEATLEAADATSESTVVASTEEVLEPEQIESGDDPGLAVSGSRITSTGVPDTTAMTTDPEDGFTIESPEGATTITPVVSKESSSVSVAAGVAGVSSNVAHEVDSVVRPEYNGVQSFQEIRSESSPETYSWEVHLGPRQKLRLANPSQAEVFYEDGTVSFLITAEPAHDATGAPVPTSLSVEGNVLTLKVEFHSKAFVYPIISGQGWETSYSAPFIVEGPEDETQIREREERERREAEEAELRERESGQETLPPPPAHYFTEAEGNRMLSFRALTQTIPAPEAVPEGAGVATASRVARGRGGLPAMAVRPYRICQIDHCGIWWVELRNPAFEYGINGEGQKVSGWEPGTGVIAENYWNGIYSPELEDETNGEGKVGPEFVIAKEGRHLTAWGRFTVKAGVFLWDGSIFVASSHPALQIWVWPNGWQENHVKQWDAGIAED